MYLCSVSHSNSFCLYNYLLVLLDTVSSMDPSDTHESQSGYYVDEFIPPGRGVGWMDVQLGRAIGLRLGLGIQVC